MKGYPLLAKNPSGQGGVGVAARGRPWRQITGTTLPPANEPSKPQNQKPQNMGSSSATLTGARKRASGIADLHWKNADLREYVKK